VNFLLKRFVADRTESGSGSSGSRVGSLHSISQPWQRRRQKEIWPVNIQHVITSPSAGVHRANPLTKNISTPLSTSSLCLSEDRRDKNNEEAYKFGVSY
jgi:hypothetical protein